MSVVTYTKIRKYLPLGKVVMTACASELLSGQDIIAALSRHKRGDWGEVSEADQRANNSALRHSGRILSDYTGADGTKFWIITEADRSYTTVLLPDEY